MSETVEKKPIKVYAYGCQQPSREVQEAIREQLYLAYRYRLVLWHLAMAGRNTYRELRRKHVPELEATEAEFLRIKELFGIVDRKEQKEEHQRLKVESQRLKAKMRELREEAKNHEGLKADMDAVHEKNGVLVRALRNVFSRTYGLYSGTYLCVEAAARSANAGTEDPAMPRWRNTGTLGIQIQGGMTAFDVHRSNAWLYIEPPNRAGKGRKAGCRTKFHYRVRSNAGKPVMVTLDAPLHREIPQDAKISWVKLAVRRSGDRYIYEVQLTLESEKNYRTEFGAGVLAVCLYDDHAKYSCEYGEPKEFLFPVDPQKLKDLQSIRDQHRNSAIGVLSGWCDRQDETADWIRDEIEAIEERRSCRRLYFLREKIRKHVDSRVMKYLDEWAVKENHLYAWQSDMRTHILRARKYAQRQFAAEMRRKYRTLLVDDRELDGRERLTDERRWLGLHELRTALVHSFGKEHVHKIKGAKTCTEMFEQYRAEQSAEAARSSESSNDSARVPSKKRAKTYGFARKHEERREAARESVSEPAE